MQNNNDINEFDGAAASVLHQDAQSTATTIRNNVQFAVGQNPDQAAQYQHLAKYVGVPVDTVRAQPEAVKQQAALQSMDADKLVAGYPSLAKYLTDPDNADKSHDDITPLATVEQAVKALPAPAAPPPSIGETITSLPMDLAKGLAGSFSKAAGSLNLALGAIPTVYDKVASLITGKPTTSASDAWFHNMVDPRVNAAPAYEVAPNARFASKAVHTVGNLAGMLSQITLTGSGGEAAGAAGTTAEVLGNAAAHGAKSMAFPALADSVETGRNVYSQTGDAQQAMRAAQMQYLTSTAAGVVPLSAPGGLATRLAGGFASGVASGEVSRQAMNLVLPGSMQQGFDAEGMILSGLSGSMLGGAMGPRAEPSYHQALRQSYVDASRAEASEQGMAALQVLSEAAVGSKTRERDPAAFREFVQSATEDGNLKEVYVNADDFAAALHQSGVDMPTLEARMPEVAAQLHEAAQTNGDIRIPVEDYATHIAGGDLDKALIEHLKVDPDGMTYHEAQDYYAGQQDAMKAQAEQLGKGQSEADAREADGQAVHDAVLAQLDALKRFNGETNKSYAVLARDFYATMADRAGMTPSEMYAKHPLKIAGEAPAGLDQANRGGFDPETNTIGLLKAADLSTYLHESGHFFLETMHDMASAADAPQGIRADFDILLSSFGEKGATPEQRLADWSAKTLDEKRAGHEQFAQGFEKYLMEGKAPTLELQGLFSRFRSWLLTVYKSLSNLNVKLSDEVRGVMDRMLASEEAIREAEQTRKYRLLFETPESAQASRELFGKYEALGTRATDEAIADMTGRSMRDLQWSSDAKAKAIKSMQRDAAEKRVAIREQVQKEIDSQPVERARAYLKSGKLFDEQGNELPDTRALGAPELKIDAEVLKAIYPKDALGNPDLSKLRGLTGKGGLHPDIVAEMFGIRDGHELVRQLIEAPPTKELVREITDQRMLEQHGELTDAAHIEQAANEAVHNDTRARFMATGLKILTKSPIPARQLVKAAREAAEAAVAAKRVRDLRPRQYLAAEARSNAEALKLAPKDPAGAVQAQRAALLNNQLFKAADGAVRNIQKQLKYLARFDRADVRAKIDLDYRDQIDDLLDRYDLRKNVSGKALDKREALNAFVERMAAAGYEPQIPEKLLNEAQRTHYKDMTVEEFTGLVDAIKSIDHLGRLKTKLLDGREAREIDDLANEAAQVMATLPQRGDESNRGLTRMDGAMLKLKSAGRSMQAALLKMEQMMDWLDDRNPNGVFNRVVFRRIAAAGVHEADMQARVKAQIDALLHSNLADVTRDKNTVYAAPGLIDGLTGKAQRFTKMEMLALAGNMGNESNMSKLLRGEKWDEGAVWDFLNKNMSKADWDFVAGLGRTLESLWPEKLAMSRRLGNTNPDKIEPRAFDTPHGRYEGWYWPMVYDPARAQDVAERGAKDADALFENIYSRANTDTGRTNTRKEGYARPLLLSLDTIPRVIRDEIHDIAYREAIMDADKFLRNGKVRKAIMDALSPEHYDQLRPWLQSIANDRKVDMAALKWFDALAHGARTRATIVGLGYRLSTMLVHGGSAAMESVAELGPVWFGKGLGDFANPMNWAANRDFVFERSGEMRNRMNEVDRDVREHLREIDLRLMDAATGAVARGTDLMKAHAYQGIAMLDMASALPTWMGAYHKAMAPEAQGGLGMTEADAVYFADKTVRNAHGGTGVKDQAAVQRGPEFFKLFTMFYTFWNHNINRLMDTGRMAGDARTWRDSGKAATVIMRFLIYTLGIQTMHGLLHPKKDDEGDTHWLAWAAEELGAAAFSGIPILRDLAAHYITGKDYSATPAAGMVDALGQTGIDAANALTGKETNPKALKHTITTAGYALGLPLGQPASTVQFLWDVTQGKQDPQDAADWWHGIIHGDIRRK